MLRAVFYKADGALRGFKISGHAGYGTEGNDIVCAAVSSCTMLVCNAVTDSFKADADVSVKENEITLMLGGSDTAAVRLLEAFYSHLESIAEDYDNVKVMIVDHGN